MRRLKTKIAKDLGRKIKKERKVREKTQCEVAQKIGLHQAAFSRIEAGTQDITAVEILLLCDAFKISINDLMSKG